MINTPFTAELKSLVAHDHDLDHFEQLFMQITPDMYPVLIASDHNQYTAIRAVRPDCAMGVRGQP